MTGKLILLFSFFLFIASVFMLIDVSVITRKRKLKNLFIDEEGNIRWLLIFSAIATFFGFIICAIFFIYVKNTSITEETKNSIAAFGQYGDFIGGVVATIFSLTGVLLLYETLRNQRHEFQKNAVSQQKQLFETRYFELIQFHRENISEIRYTKFYRAEMQTSEARKAFRVIADEYLTCLHEFKRFLKLYPSVDFIKPRYRHYLNYIKKINRIRASVEEIAIIDIAYCYLFFGASKESEPIILHKFFNRYDRAFINKIKFFFQLKPKGEFSLHFNNWKYFLKKPVFEMRDLFEEMYAAKSNPISNPSDEAKALLQNIDLEKYYGGHQHRLGHYFRHLFQSYKFLTLQKFLSDDEKYTYAKTLRAQLSTYEQLMLFFNSISSLGMNWDYTADAPVGYNMEAFKFITRYNLIKNLPGSQYVELQYRKYYKNVNFEYQDDPTYMEKFNINQTHN